MSTTKTSPSWKRPISERLKASFGSNPLPPPQTLPSQLPTADQQIRLNLEDTTLIFDNGRWITGLYLFQSSSLSLSIHLLNFSVHNAQHHTHHAQHAAHGTLRSISHAAHNITSNYLLLLPYSHLPPFLSRFISHIK